MLLSKLQAGVLRNIKVKLKTIDDDVHIRQLSMTAFKELQSIEDEDERAAEILLRTITDEKDTKLTREMLDEIRDNNPPDLLPELYQAFSDVNVPKDREPGEA